MRKFKFRAWDSLKKIMVTKENVEELIEKIEQNYYFKDEDVPYSCRECYPFFYIEGIFSYFDNIQYNNSLFSEMVKNRFKVMQFTGLKDKNGKEIYEGDILKFSEVDTAVVEWNEKYSYFMVKPIQDYCFDSDVLGHALEYNDNVEIIGNIYAESKLLESEE